MRWSIILTGLVFASAAFLVQPVEAQVVSTVSGDVCGSWDPEWCEQPLDADVRLTGGPGGVVEDSTTAQDGSFSFDNVPDGDYELTVTHKGFTTAVLAITTPTDHLQVILEPERVEVEGIVRAGDPVPDARISFWGPDYASARTDDAGTYRVELQAGAYTMEVDAGKRGYVQQEVFVDGSRIDVDLAGLEGQVASVTGQVIDQDQRPVAGVDVIIHQWTESQGEYRDARNWTTTDAEGRYEAQVFEGGLDIQFRKDGYSQAYEWAEVKAGDVVEVDASLTKYPEKTARIQGQVLGSEGPLGPVTISIEHPEYGIYTCSDRGGHGAPEPMYYGDEAEYHGGYDAGCDITVQPDGSFTGNVTPGYAILNVWYDHWSSCQETHHSDGSYERACGPDYFSYTQTLVLEENADNPITIELRPRPVPDATVSGYLVDADTDTAVPQARISFSNQQTYGWGDAQTDGDGSYKIRVHSGYHQVSVRADGYLPWQGMLFIGAGEDAAFDVQLSPGEARYGGCCGVVYAEEASHDASGPMPVSSAPTGGAPAGGDGYSSGSGGDFEDLGGGLGPYDPEQRAASLESSGKQSPVPVALVLVGLVVALIRRR